MLGSVRFKAAEPVLFIVTTDPLVASGPGLVVVSVFRPSLPPAGARVVLSKLTPPVAACVVSMPPVKVKSPNWAVESVGVLRIESALTDRSVSRQSMASTTARTRNRLAVVALVFSAAA